jgi:hypothetical protein
MSRVRVRYNVWVAAGVVDQGCSCGTAELDMVLRLLKVVILCDLVAIKYMYDFECCELP